VRRTGRTCPKELLVSGLIYSNRERFEVCWVNRHGLIQAAAIELKPKRADLMIRMFGPPSSFHLAVLIFAGLGVASCGASRVRFADLAIGAGDILWLPAGAEILACAASPVSAESGRSLYADGSADACFNMTGERHELSAGLIRHFATAGWRQRTAQYLNPRIKTSFDEGWQHRCGCVVETDPEGHPISREPSYEWRGEWEDPLGTIVTYSLRTEGRLLRGYATYSPPRLIGAARQLH
jgi:hypothetical protein